MTVPYFESMNFQASLYALLYDKLITVVGWNRKKSFSAMIGINHIAVYDTELDIVLSYTTMVQKAAVGINNMEVSVRYGF